MIQYEKIIYSSYLTSDRELVANITLPDRKILQQRCIINSIIDELADIGFTGEELPEWMHICLGSPLELRGHGEHGPFGCRAVVVDINVVGHYLIRLVGSIYYGELRDFQRLDVYLPCRFRESPSSNIDEISDRWLSPYEGDLRTEWKQRDQNSWMDPADHENVDESIPLLALASREQCIIEAPVQLRPGSFIELQLLIPETPPNVVRTYARVERCDPHALYESGKTTSRMTVSYVLIKPADREAIGDYVNALQVLHSTELCKDAQYEALYNRLKQEAGYRDPLLYAKRALAVVIIAVLLFLLGKSLNDYRKGHEKGFIERTFEEGIRRYQEKFK